MKMMIFAVSIGDDLIYSIHNFEKHVLSILILYSNFKEEMATTFFKEFLTECKFNRLTLESNFGAPYLSKNHTKRKCYMLSKEDSDSYAYIIHRNHNFT